MRSLDDLLRGLKGRRIRLILRKGLEAIENPTSGFVMIGEAKGESRKDTVEGILTEFYMWTTHKAKYIGRTLGGYNFTISQDEVEVLMI